MAVTTGTLLVAFGVLAGWAWSRSESNGVLAAAVVCGVCWVSGVIALSMPMIFRDPPSTAHGVLLGMLLRMGLPLLAGLHLTRSRSELLEVGVMGMFVGVYLLGLIVETGLSWWIAETNGAEASGVAKAS
jgi:uncharacterized membrane protein